MMDFSNNSVYIYTYTNVRLSQTNLNDPPKGIPTNTDTSFGELVTWYGDGSWQL